MAAGAYSTEFKVGLFTLLALSVLVAIAVTLEGNPFASRRLGYHTDLTNVGGVGPKTQVRTSGVPIGEVTHIEILDNGARVFFELDAEVVIPKGTYIELRSRGILGDVYLEIVRNQNFGVSEQIPPGGLIPKVKEMDDLNALMSSLGSIAKDIKTVSNTLKNVIGNEDGQSTLKNILGNIEEITETSKVLVAQEGEKVSALITSLRDASARINEILMKNDERVDDLIISALDATSDVREFAEKLRSLLSGENEERFNRILAAVDVSMDNLKLASDKVQLIVDKVERGEGTIGQLVAKDDTANDIRQTLREVQDVLRPATKLEIVVDYKGELRSSETVGRFGNHFNFMFRTRPDRYYLLGVSDSPQSEKITRERRTTDAAGELIETDREVIWDKPKIRFNAQFAKRFDFIALRFGLFESSAGVAGDLYLWSDRIQASVEAFSFMNDPPSELRENTEGLARVKTYANLFLTPNVYLTAGADNVMREVGPLGFVGLGLRFRDDDIKSLFGAAALSSSF